MCVSVCMCVCTCVSVCAPVCVCVCAPVCVHAGDRTHRTCQGSSVCVCACAHVQGMGHAACQGSSVCVCVRAHVCRGWDTLRVSGLLSPGMGGPLAGLWTPDAGTVPPCPLTSLSVASVPPAIRTPWSSRSVSSLHPRHTASPCRSIQYPSPLEKPFLGPGSSPCLPESSSSSPHLKFCPSSLLFVDTCCRGQRATWSPATRRTAGQPH